ncbi:MAG: M23 family metallopeptidase [Candidatus Doudnabacteria bacterium]|nr:M23 family metallopeptidase [Candidatus Doudnabacteria bacterium]
MNTSDYKTKTPLALPFKGTWIVGNGGRNPSKNNHLGQDGDGPENQMFAYDFTKDHSNEGKDLEDYEAFGSEVIAPADGVISQVIDGNQDNPIGESDWVMLSGNTIVIDHGNGEWSVLAHFKHNSISVKVGDKVKQGDVLGLCGNTGNTSEPHIHYHLQDGPNMHNAKGLPAQFTEITVDDKLVQDAEPEGDQTVSN